MESFNKELGAKIKFFRKKKGLSLNNFARMINKSYSTASKYENGLISIDVKTFYEILSCLEIAPEEVMQVKEKGNPKVEYALPKYLYCYHYLASKKRIIKSVIENKYREDDDYIVDAKMYIDVSDVNEVSSCKFLYYGQCDRTSMVVNYKLINKYNKSDVLSISILNSLRGSQSSNGMVMGIIDNPFAISATKLLVLRDACQDDEAIRKFMCFDKNEISRFKRENRFVVPYEDFSNY